MNKISNLKIIKFDVLYPSDYLNYKINLNKNEIDKMSFHQFHIWLIKLRMNYSDFYTFNLSYYGWDAKEFFLDNDLYMKKCGLYCFGYSYYVRKHFHRFRNLISHLSIPFSEKIIEKYIKKENPSVLFIREKVFVRSRFWEQFLSSKLVVSRIDCGIPHDWTPFSFDLIYTNIPPYINFFVANNISTKSNNNGFDERILKEIKPNKKKYDITFVGGLGDYYGFIDKTIFLEKLLNNLGESINFIWWGYKTGDFDNQFPNLASKYQGSLSGLDMFNIYSQSKIVFNDYGTGLGGVAVNQRIYEVLGIGTLLVTRQNDTFNYWNDCLVTYNDINDCIEKLMFYLKNDIEREKIAKKGQFEILKKFTYKFLMKQLSDELTVAYNQKFNNVTT
jgi:hypothetical protein